MHMVGTYQRLRRKHRFGKTVPTQIQYKERGKYLSLFNFVLQYGRIWVKIAGNVS